MRGTARAALLAAAIATATGGETASDAQSHYIDPDRTAIVVFTGNENRIAAGLRMYMNGAAPRLFITGNDEFRGTLNFLQDYNIPITRPLDGIVFDREARDTIENARNASVWMAQQRIQRVYLVTSDFHMSRSLRLLREEAPRPLITACPISSDTNTQTIAGENLKYAAIAYAPNILLDVPRSVRAKISGAIVYTSNFLPTFKAPTNNAGPC